MACSLTAPCGGILMDDGRFNADAEREGLSVRRATCLCGHSFYNGPPPTLRGFVPKPPSSNMGVAKLNQHKR